MPRAQGYEEAPFHCWENIPKEFHIKGGTKKKKNKKRHRSARVINPATFIDQLISWLLRDIPVHHLENTRPIYPGLKVLQDMGLSVVESGRSGQTEMDQSPTPLTGPQGLGSWADHLQKWLISDTVPSDTFCSRTFSPSILLPEPQRSWFIIWISLLKDDPPQGKIPWRTGSALRTLPFGKL